MASSAQSSPRSNYVNYQPFRNVPGLFKAIRKREGIQEPVVLKVISNTCDTNERKLLEDAKHPNIISAVETWSTPSCDIVAMPELVGGDVCDWIMQGKVFSWRHVVGFTQQMASALCYLHTELGFVHADVSLENILLIEEEEGRIRFILTDFGLSYPKSARFVCGKEFYAAPEVHDTVRWLGGEYVDVTKIDVFALGICLFTIVFNNYPFLTTSAGKCKGFLFFGQHGLESFLRHCRFPSSSTNRQCISALIEGMLCPSPGARFSMPRVISESNKFVR